MFNVELFEANLFDVRWNSIRVRPMASPFQVTKKDFGKSASLAASTFADPWKKKFFFKCWKDEKKRDLTFMDENDQSLRIEYRVCEWVLEIKCAHGDEQSCWELSECFLCRRKIPSKEAKKRELYATAEWRLRENWHIQRPFSWKAWRFFSLFLVKLGSKLQTRNPLKEFLGKILSSFVTILSIGFWIVEIGQKIPRFCFLLFFETIGSYDC